MSYQVLARKWRPRRFEEVIGQDHVTRALQNVIKQEKIAHAYLFTGTRGVGKTTIARIFSKAIKCENKQANQNPCLTCQTCLEIEAQNSIDYIEIDGASNNSVDSIRSLIENVVYLPSKGKFKIYVIDEVHMLTTSAFNALLKTLEEPPAHVIFMFATTDPHKLLGTVLSRVQRFDFKSVQKPILVEHFKKIANSEGIVFENEHLIKELAEQSQGSVRDGLSLLDQILSLSLDKKITEEIFSMSLGLVGQKILNQLFLQILDENPIEATKSFENISNQNIDISKFNIQFIGLVFNTIQAMDDQNPSHDKYFQLFPPLKGISFAEIFWIFETFNKDIEWALKSPSPLLTINLVLQKLARRRQIYKPDVANIKKATEPQKKTEILTIQKPIKIEQKFINFIQTLSENAPSIKGQLERGCNLTELEMRSERYFVQYGFEESNKDACEYLQDNEIFPKLKLLMADFYKTTDSLLEINWKLISKEEKLNLGFLSFNEQHEKITKVVEDKKKDKLINDPYIKEAEKLFNSKIDKIILKQE